MNMSSYNVYKCETCQLYIDAQHVMILSLKIQCYQCGQVMNHNWQIDMATFEENGW